MYGREAVIENADIAIVGGGMVGLSQALLLAGELPGARIVLFESLAFAADEAALLQPSFDARSTALSAATAELLQLMNVWSPLAQRAQPIKRVHVSDRGHVGATDYCDSDNHGKPLGYVIENRCFGYYLSQAVLRCDNITVIAPACVTAIRPKVLGAELQFECEGERKSLNVQLVIIGDGMASPLRSQLGIGVESHDYQQVAVIANLEFELPHNGQAFERFTEAGPLAVLPLPPEAAVSAGGSRRAALVWTQASKSLAEIQSCTDQDFIQQLHHAFGFRLGNCTRVGERHSYPLKMVFAKEQVRSSIVLIGNAAHFLHPVAGQGFNLAIRDCAQLAAVLSQAVQNNQPLGDLTVLQRYLKLQALDQQATASISHAFIRVFTHPNIGVQLGRNLSLLGLGLSDTLKGEFFAQMMGQSLPRAKVNWSALGTYN